MCQPRVDRSVGSPSLEDSDIRIEKKWNWKEKRQEEPDFSQSGFQFALCEWLVSTKGSGAAKRKSYKSHYKTFENLFEPASFIAFGRLVVYYSIDFDIY